MSSRLEKFLEYSISWQMRLIRSFLEISCEPKQIHPPNYRHSFQQSLPWTRAIYLHYLAPTTASRP
jgi:hypothetical protein